jgi:membrane dipeptidase
VAGRLAIAFNLEGFGALGGQVEMVSLYHDLGVRWMLIAYNQNNLGGGGCQDEDGGLTDFGRQVIEEMERVGMVVCCSHTGYRTALEVMAQATRPVILSHSNPRALVDHPRNVPDEVMQACAATGGVMGITGVSLFLGGAPEAARILEHIEYAVGRIGVEHVGLGIDTCFDSSEVLDYMSTMPERFGALRGYDDGLAIAGPEVIPAVAEGLLARGFSEADAAKIMGGNFLRVAREVWRA